MCDKPIFVPRDATFSLCNSDERRTVAMKCRSKISQVTLLAFFVDGMHKVKAHLESGLSSYRESAQLAIQGVPDGRTRARVYSRMARGIWLVSVAFVGTALIGCGSGSEPPEARESQVLASVNGSEITLTHLQYQLQRETAPYQSLDELRKRALDTLIEQELLKQRALDNKLDQDPDVMVRIETSRNRLLADAYVQQKVIPQTRVRPEEVETYYYQNPALFRQRKQYELTVFNVDQPLKPEVLASLDGADTPVKIVEKLRAAEIRFQSNAVHRLADQLPLAVIDKFAAASVGDLVYLQGNDGSAVLSLVQAVQDAGVSLDESRTAIENYLINIRNREAYAQTLSQIRSGAVIEYFGDYARLQQSGEEVAPAAKPSPASGETKPAVNMGPSGSANDKEQIES